VERYAARLSASAAVLATALDGSSP
jgi:hypothetical protein